MKVYFLSLLKDTPKRGFWDQGLLEDLLKDFDKEEVESLPKEKYGIVVIPARSHYKIISLINKELSKIDNVLLFLTGDEEHVFPVEEIKHPNIKIWVQNPQMGRHDKYGKLGTGYPPALTKYKRIESAPDKPYGVLFAGQITHQRRQSMASELERNTFDNLFMKSEGFAQGLPQDDYYFLLSQAKIAPCPSGPETVDTFRLFEALELGCIPFADSKTPKEDMTGFWEWLFDCPVPFPIISEWEQLPGYVNDMKKLYPQANNRIQAWWIRTKLNLQIKIYNDLTDLGFPLKAINDDFVTVIIPVSPIPSHPSIDILMETITSVLFHLPKAKILLTFDGVRKEQENKRADYEEHIRRVLWNIGKFDNVSPIIFEEHLHQSGMMREIIDLIDTPLLLYVEQDTPLVIDEKIDWFKITAQILSGKSNLVRFHHEGIIPREHEYLMLGGEETGFLETMQWSQRPHIASVPFYRRLMNEHFTNDSRCFIEDKIYGKAIEDFKRDDNLAWNQWRMHIYYPNKKNIKRSYHLDGREGASKFDDKQAW